MRNVLIFGGLGFIGSNLAESFSSIGDQVTVFDNFTRGKLHYISQSLNDPRCRIWPHGGDIRDIDLLDDAMKEVDGVIHLAAMWLLHCRDYPRTAFHVNIEGTFNVLEACVKNNIKRLVYSSSASVYGDATEVPMTENHPFNNRNFYGATKIAGEAMCRAYYDRYGLDYVGLRYMNVYGPRQDQHAVYSGVIPIMLNNIDAGKAPTVNGDGTQAYDFIYVEDVGRSNICAMESDSTDQFYNVGTGIQTTIKELCDTILDLKGSDLKVQYQPYAEDDARQLVQNRIGCPKLAQQDLGFEHQFNLKSGLQKLIDWRDAAK